MADKQRFSRENLYELVWEDPPSRLAKRFGLSDVGFSKLCRRLEVPLPGRGYWRQKEVGRKVTKPKLPRFSGRGPDWVELYVHSAEEIERAEVDARERRREPDDGPQAPVVPIPATLGNLSESGIRTHEQLAKAKPTERGVVEAAKAGLYAIAVTPAQLGRAVRIMDGFACACRAADIQVKLSPRSAGGMSVTVEGERLGILLEEKIRRREKEHTPEELRERKKHPYRWYSKEYEYIPTGELTLRVTDGPYGGRCQWRDGKRQRVETSLGQVIQQLFVLARGLKAQRAQREAQQREWEEQARRREELRAEIAAEEKRVAELTAAANAWHESQRLRAYAEAVRTNHQMKHGVIEPDSEIGRWLQWATAQADRLDPLVENPPSVLDEYSGIGRYW